MAERKSVSWGEALGETGRRLRDSGVGRGVSALADLLAPDLAEPMPSGPHVLPADSGAWDLDHPGERDRQTAYNRKMAGAIGQGMYEGYDLPRAALMGEKQVYDPATGHTAQSAIQWGADRALNTAGSARATAAIAPHLAKEAAGAAGANIGRKADDLGKALEPIRAYHGSPHDFDKFSLDKIGTGEGAQAYGHGLYFAENEGVAEAYKNSVTRNAEQLAEIAKARGLPPDAAQLLVENYTRDFGGKRFDDWLDDLRKSVDSPFVDPRSKAAAQQILDKSVEASDAFSAMKAPGRIYEVQINADPDRFLDWDKPLSGQPKELQEAVLGARYKGNKDAVAKALEDEDYLGRSMGAHMYDLEHPSVTGGRDKASAALKEAGIPGIKYLDQASRGTGEGSRNYVVFSDEIINIVKKYGIAGLALLPPAVLAQHGIDPASVGASSPQADALER